MESITALVLFVCLIVCACVCVCVCALSQRHCSLSSTRFFKTVRCTHKLARPQRAPPCYTQRTLSAPHSYLLVSLFVRLSVCRGGGEAVVKVLVKYDPSVQYSKAYRPFLLGAFQR